VGRLEIYPNSPNVVPSRTTLLIELRSMDVSLLEAADNRLAERLGQIAAETGTQVVIEDRQLRPPAKLHDGVADLALDTCRQLGLAAENSVTVAGHDAISLSRVCPAGLVFIPSQNGLSHNEAESTSVQDMENGLRFLTAFLYRLSHMSQTPDTLFTEIPYRQREE
jgi:N-carbamoyl-L-amino-acid hydrolase